MNELIVSLWSSKVINTLIETCIKRYYVQSIPLKDTTVKLKHTAIRYKKKNISPRHPDRRRKTPIPALQPTRLLGLHATNNNLSSSVDET